MAQSEVTQSNLYFTGAASQAGEITSLRAAIASGSTIYANDLNRISTLINNMNGHYHNYTDIYQLANYGNTGDRTNYFEFKDTSGPDSTITAPTDTAANTAITASRHNELKDSINTLRNHYHSIDDRTA
jgi:hypothetical protein